MYKKFSILILLLASIYCGNIHAQSSGFGIGFKLGVPTGISAKYWLNGTNALNFGLGYSISKGSQKVHFTADYLYNQNDVIKAEEQFPLFYGFGMRFLSEEHENGSLGVRGVIGIAWYPREAPVDVFIEMAPVFKLIPSTSLDLDISAGARWFF